MTKIELIAELNNRYAVVWNIHSVGVAEAGILPYEAAVYETGFSEANRLPTGYKKTVNFYVRNEGLPEESAEFVNNEPKNTSNLDVSCKLADVGLFSSYEKIYNSAELRKRILGWILKIVATVFSEPAGTADHSLRVKWAYDAFKTPAKYVDVCMGYIAQSNDVKVKGAACPDADLAWLGYMVTTIATMYGFTND